MQTETLEKKEVSFVSGNLVKAMLIFTGPFILGILLQNLYGAVDLFVVGHYATTADVSAVTIGSQLMTIITQLIIGLATAITMLIGQYYGAKDKNGLSRTIGASVSLFGVIAILLTVVYIAFNAQLVTALQTPQEALVETKEYLFFCSLGIIFIVGYNVISCILTGLGDSKTPFIFIFVACMINVTLDIILVKYIGLGAKGAAIATTIAQAGSFFFSLIFLRYKGLGFSVHKSDIRFNKEQIKLILQIGGPVALQNVLVSASFLFITAIINSMGVIASAAVGVVEKLITFLFVPAIAMGTAVGASSAQNIGANQISRAKKSLWIGIIIAFVPAVIITLYCQFFGKSLTGILTQDAEVVLLAADYLRSYVFDVIMVSFVFSMNGFFNSCGKSWFSLVHSLISTFLARIPLALFFSRLDNSSLYIVGWAAPISTFISVILCSVFLFRMYKEKPSQRLEPAPSENCANAAPKFVITIAREYGSGGRLIGEKVAQKLGVSFYNRNLIDLTAERSGLAKNYITNWEERVSSRFIWSNSAIGRNVGSLSFGQYYSNADIMFRTQSQIIRDLAEKESCVIVGRCADYILRDHPNCINIFIHANEDDKLARLIGEYDVNEADAAETASATNKGRSNYYLHYTGRHWGDIKLYHITINSSLFGIEGAADIITSFIRQRYQ